MGATENRKDRQDPCDLNNSDLILWFDDLGTGNEECNFLSNFFIGEILTLPGVTWEALAEACRIPAAVKKLLRTGDIEFISGEHAFAALKFWGTDFDHFVNIVEARDYSYEYETQDGEIRTSHVDACNHAKSLGRSRQHPLRKDWEEVKLDVMAAITRAKYAIGRDEANRLLATGDRLLVEGTFWNDEVWGVDLTAGGMPGRNWLGSILMMRRAELRALGADARVTMFVKNTGAYNLEFGAPGVKVFDA